MNQEVEVPYCPECGADCDRQGDHDVCLNEDCGAVYHLDRADTDVPLRVLQ